MMRPLRDTRDVDKMGRKNNNFILKKVTAFLCPAIEKSYKNGHVPAVSDAPNSSIMNRHIAKLGLLCSGSSTSLAAVFNKKKFFYSGHHVFTTDL